MTTREMADKLDVTNSAADLRLQQLDYVNKVNVWVAHEVKEIHLTKRVNICESIIPFELLRRNLLTRMSTVANYRN